MKYIVCGVKPGPYGTDTRPTQEQVKSFGPGEYTLRKGDGSVSKHFLVSTNRNGNLKMEASSPDGLDAISTLNLERMVRDYARIVKCWPKSPSARDYKKVVDEVQARAVLVGSVTSRRAWDEGKAGCVIGTDGVGRSVAIDDDGSFEPEAERAALVVAS